MTTWFGEMSAALRGGGWCRGGVGVGDPGQQPGQERVSEDGGG